MKREDIIRMAREADLWMTSDERIAAVLRFAELVAAHKEKEMQDKIDTLYMMYEQAKQQRDYLMDQQSAMVAAMRGRTQ